MNLNDIQKEIDYLKNKLLENEKKIKHNIRPQHVYEPQKLILKNIKEINFIETNYIYLFVGLSLFIIYIQHLFFNKVNITYAIPLSLALVIIIRCPGYFSTKNMYKEWQKENELKISTYNNALLKFEKDKLIYQEKLEEFLKKEALNSSVITENDNLTLKIKNLVSLKHDEMKSKGLWNLSNMVDDIDFMEGNVENNKYGRSNPGLKKENSKEEPVTISKGLFCPKCGFKFTHKIEVNGKIVGGVSGAVTGAILGAKIGIAGGPLGAISGTIPGAILGGVFGKNTGNNFDKPTCPSCKTTFELPNNI
jgi:hypothetical protein